MAEVAPFAGLRFRGMPLSDVIAPPYDVIAPDEQERLYARSPYNVIRLELGREADRYAEARRCYEEWRTAGVLTPDPTSFYVYEQRFRPPAGGGSREPGAAGQFVRRGLFARVKLEPWAAGVVLPHEETLTKPKQDRLDLIRAVGANVSPVFSLYEDPGEELAGVLASMCENPPTAEARDDAGEDHRLWQMADGALVQRIAAFFAGKQLFIADGHHRYETALAYRDEARTPDAGYVLMALVDFADPGLVVLPIHRLIDGLSKDQLRQLADHLGDYFEVIAAAEETSPKATEAALSQLASQPRASYVLHGPKPSGLRVVALKPEWQSTAFDPSHSEAWNRLDVAVLHCVLARVLGFQAEDLASERYFAYTREPDMAVRQVQRGEAQLALLLRPTPATAIKDVALAGDKMPQKSTYFYPKLATGLVINPLQ